ncbi:MAG: SUMF1/EgtB/PvdO family nonheme iron enzyme [Anaerolineaceae bacterium]|nr:SUMF1/EgtB/PvdO family nonheme iron enzyme [Anaerolineaceae bacterium]
MDYSGQRFEHYQLIARLGQGGMATVYRAYDTRLERDVAIKVVRKESIPPEQLERILKRFEREAKALAKFIHPNIVPVHDYGEFQGAPFLVMAYLPGGTLKEQIGQPLPVQTALNTVIPIAGALSYAHQRGVIHRDVKPSNILTTEDGALMLSDFGIAQMLEEATTQLTATGMGVGTPEYMAPEQWLGKATAASDQYALGVVLFELLTGQKPYSAETPLAVALKVMSEPLPRPSDLAPEIPDEVEKVLYKVLARDPQDRYEDMEALRKALGGFATRRNALPMKEKGEAAIVAADATKEKKRIEEPVVAASEIERVGEITADEKPELASQEWEPQAREDITRDKLDATPVEELRAAPKDTQKKHGVPKWVLWGGIGVICAIFLCLAITLGGSVTSLWKDENRSSSVSPTKTSTQEPVISINEKDGAEMVYVPAGEFLMGSEDGDSDEAPEHTVYLDAYWIYQHEVTNEQYAVFLNEMGNQTEDSVTWLDISSTYTIIHESGGEWTADSGYEDHPVVEVTWYGAQAYCEWAGGGLPTEAQWEKAARGEDGNTYPWGEASPNCDLAQYSGCSGDAITVGSLPAGASEYGALDMAGNVWEWVADWYDAGYYEDSSSQNPKGPASGMYRVLRSGAWHNNERYLRASNRHRNDPGSSNDYNGFRCVPSGF